MPMTMNGRCVKHVLLCGAGVDISDVSNGKAPSSSLIVYGAAQTTWWRKASSSSCGVRRNCLGLQSLELRRRRNGFSSSNSKSTGSVVPITCSGSGHRALELLVKDEEVSYTSTTITPPILLEEDEDNELDNKQQGPAFLAELDRNSQVKGNYDDVLQFLASGSGNKNFFQDVQIEVDGKKKKPWWEFKLEDFIKPRIQGILLLNLLTFLYGSNISVIKEVESVFDPAFFSLGRFTIASLVFLPFLGNALDDKRLFNAAFELGLWASTGYLTQAFGLLTTDAGRASFISTFTVIVVPLFAGLLGARIPTLTWGAGTAALVGVGLLESSGAPPSIGDAWILVSAMFFGIHMLRTEYHSRRFGRDASMPIISLQLWMITLSSLIWSCCSQLSSGHILPDLHTMNWNSLQHATQHLPWFPILYTGFVTTAFCLWSELLAMRSVGATEAAVIFTLEPLWGAAFAWFLLGERWGLRGWIGAAFILGGSLVMQVWGAPEEVIKSSKTQIASVEASELGRKEVINPLVDDFSTETNRLEKPTNGNVQLK
ncbi:unnamed protein product [Sphagnum troendelagicum]|uniref:EamA domain-containing protein n=1 Tax=Sphagnum troendelagicum TaxID=128251 RepID=A0ABP0TEC9_9BRYO